MSELRSFLQNINQLPSREKPEIVAAINDALTKAAYTVVEQDQEKPWGAYLRTDDDDSEKFLSEFFPGLSLDDARRGVDGAPLSPKILIVSPGARLSEQVHERRAERWHYLTPGYYIKASKPGEGEFIRAEPGDVVQFDRGEVHRLSAESDSYTVVAEVWQHSDPSQPSDEYDITRYDDDYHR